MYGVHISVNPVTMPSNHLRYHPQLQPDVCNHTVAHGKQGTVWPWPYAERPIVQRFIYNTNPVNIYVLI